MIICISNQDLSEERTTRSIQSILGYLLIILLLIELELKHRIEGLDVVQIGLMIRNDTRLMEDLLKHSAPIRLSLMTFAKPENAGQGKGFGGSSQDTDLLFEEKVIQCMIHENKPLRNKRADPTESGALSEMNPL